MTFTTLKEYFFKIQNVVYITALVPLLVFIVLVVGVPPKLMLVKEEDRSLLTWGIAGFAMMDSILVFVVFQMAMLQIRKARALSEKLDRYFSITLVKFVVLMMAGLVLSAGFYLTDDALFIYLFGPLLGLYLFSWPSASAACKHLRLRGDEYEMVYHKKERF